MKIMDTIFDVSSKYNQGGEDEHSKSITNTKQNLCML